MLTPAQYRSTSFGSQTSTQRRYGSLGLRLFYSNNTSTYRRRQHPGALGPADDRGRLRGARRRQAWRSACTSSANPAAGIQETWVTYSEPRRRAHWTSLDLTQDPDDSTLWTGTLPSGAMTPLANLRFIVQSVNGVGLVTLDDNNGAYYRIGASDTAPEPAGDAPRHQLARRQRLLLVR